MLDPTRQESFQRLSVADQIGILQVLGMIKRAHPAISQHLRIDDDYQKRLEVGELERLERL
jgi:hypothetical protein